MPLRSHLGRSMDPSLLSNRLIIGLTGLVAVAAVVVWMIQGDLMVLWAPGHVFVAWALLRELDPDHDWSALLAGAGAGVWALGGLPLVSLLPLVGFLLAARLVVNSTGRRPLPTDLAVVAVYAVAISFTSIGFLAGFAIALGFYIDDRMTEEHDLRSVLAAGLTALGASIVATAASAFPSRLPEIRPLAVTGVGVLALIAILREPEAPTSLVDSRKKSPIRTDRVHTARSLFGIMIFLAAVVSGAEVAELVPTTVVLVLTLASNEVERVRRRR